jgi:hypothetical protein
MIRSPRGLPPCGGEKVLALQCSGELCWRELKLLVVPHMAEGSKCRGKRSIYPGPPS